MNLELIKENFGKYVERQEINFDNIDDEICKRADLMAKMVALIGVSGGELCTKLALDLIGISKDAALLKLIKKTAEEGDSSE